MTRAELRAELQAAEDRGVARGAQAMEAELRPRLTAAEGERGAWREAAKWIAAGGISLGALGALFSFLEGFRLGAGGI